MAGWKTVIASLLVVLLGIFEALRMVDTMALLVAFGVPAELARGWVAVIGVIFFLLRMATNSPVLKDKP